MNTMGEREVRIPGFGRQGYVKVAKAGIKGAASPFASFFGDFATALVWKVSGIDKSSDILVLYDKESRSH